MARSSTDSLPHADLLMSYVRRPFELDPLVERSSAYGFKNYGCIETKSVTHSSLEISSVPCHAKV